MNIAPFLAKACQELDKAMQGTLDGTKIACISETISGYAIAAAIASGVAGVAPGFAGVAAALTQEVSCGQHTSRSTRHWVSPCRRTRQSSSALPSSQT